MRAVNKFPEAVADEEGFDLPEPVKVVVFVKFEKYSGVERGRGEGNRADSGGSRGGRRSHDG